MAHLLIAKERGCEYFLQFAVLVPASVVAQGQPVQLDQFAQGSLEDRLQGLDVVATVFIYFRAGQAQFPVPGGLRSCVKCTMTQPRVPLPQRLLQPLPGWQKRGSTWNTPQSRNWRRIFGAPSNSRKLSGLMSCSGNSSASWAALRAFCPSMRMVNSPCRSRETPRLLVPPSANCTSPNTVQADCSYWITGFRRVLRNDRASPSKCTASSTLVLPLPLAP